MKFIRTSSRVNDLNVDDSICLDISHISQYLSQTNFDLVDLIWSVAIIPFLLWSPVMNAKKTMNISTNQWQ